MEQLAELRRRTKAVMCAECGKCTSVCPLAWWSDYSPRVIASRDPARDADGEGPRLERCLTCAACELRCPHDVRFTELIQRMREMAGPASGDAHCPHGGALHSVMRMMARNGRQQNRLGWLSDALKTEAEKGEVFYWTGCAMYYDAFFADLGVTTLAGNRAAIRLMNRLGTTPVLSPQERCCGHDLLFSGDRESFEALARHNVKLVNESGAKTLVTSCAECLRTWKIDYAPYVMGKPLKIVHFTEFLADRLSELKFPARAADAADGGKVNGRRRVTFQDPCRLGRHLEIYDPPRQVLAAVPGLELAEMAHAGRSATCCAGNWSYCDGCAKDVQVQRLREARGTGADVLVTACPKCQIHLRCAMKDPNLHEGIEIKMRDVAEVVEEALSDQPSVGESGR